MSEPRFGDWLRGIYASETNPIRDGMYVRTIRRSGRMNPGKYYELTDGKGKFWQYVAASTERIEPPVGSDAHQLRALRDAPVVEVVHGVDPHDNSDAGEIVDFVDESLIGQRCRLVPVTDDGETGGTR